MAGTAKTNAFLLSTATVCIGAAADLYKLNPTAHSIGLVKNFQMQSDPTFVELTQGVRQSPVMSIRNNDGLKCSFETYEFTYRNLAYASGLDASGIAFDPNPTIWASSGTVAAAATTAIVVGDVTATLAVGDWVFLQQGADDYIHVAQVTARTYSSPNTTITFANHAVPAGISFTAGYRAGKLASVKLGSQQVQPDLAAKIIGTMPKDGRPVVLLFPKIKITKGFQLAFQADNFANMPFEFTPYSLVSTDPFYADFGNDFFQLLSGV